MQQEKTLNKDVCCDGGITGGITQSSERIQTVQGRYEVEKGKQKKKY